HLVVEGLDHVLGDVDLRRAVHHAGLPALDDEGVALLLSHLGEDPFEVAEDLLAHDLLLLLQLLLQVVEEATDVPGLPLEGFLLLAAGVGGEELALLLELVAQLVVVDLLAVDLLLHGRLLLLDLLAGLHAGLGAREDPLEVDVADAGGGERGRRGLLRHGGRPYPPESRPGPPRPQRGPEDPGTPYHSSLLLGRNPRPALPGPC